MRVDVAGRDRLDAEVLREVAQQRVPAGVSSLERALDLDEEALAPERRREPRRAVRVADTEPLPRAAGEADESLLELRDPLERRPRAEAARGLRARAAASPRAPR